MDFVHKSVLFDESINALNIDNKKIILDGTAGGGGHSREIAINAGRLIAVDQDPDAIKVLGERLGGFENVTIVKNNFSNIKQILADLGIDKIDGVLLGVRIGYKTMIDVKNAVKEQRESLYNSLHGKE